MKKQTTLTLIIGVSGKGNSTLANKIKRHYEYMNSSMTVRKTDDHFAKATTGESIFDPENPKDNIALFIPDNYFAGWEPERLKQYVESQLANRGMHYSQIRIFK